MRKRLIYIAMTVIIILILAVPVTKAYKEERHERNLKRAEEQFCEEIVPKYQEELRKAGLSDIVVTPVIEKSEYFDYCLVVTMEYSSQEIDALYVTSEEDEKFQQLLDQFRAIFEVYEKYSDKYEYTIRGEELVVDFDDLGSINILVNGGKHTYSYYHSYRPYESVAIDDESIYYREKSYRSSTTSGGSINNSSSSGSTSWSGSTGNSATKEDEYDVYDYSDPEDFYFDNYEDFYEYDEAEDYYNEAWDE